jgi:nucleotide-binding universal stress UspA family protein
MTLKHILLPLSGEPDGEDVALAALALAREFSAHVSAGYEDTIGPLYAPTMGFIPSAQLFGDFYDEMQKLRNERMVTARSQFDEAVVASGLLVVSGVTCGQGSVMWRTGVNAPSLSQLGLIFDLAVVPSPGEKMSPGPWSLVENLLFGSGAAVVLMPRAVKRVDFSRPLIAWNGSREATRALQFARGLFPKGARPVIAEVGKMAPDRIPAACAVEYLGWHGCTAERRAIDGKDHDAPEILQNLAQDLGATCVVMGAYTHGRARQFFLGGLTDFMLRNATLPTVMSH